MSRIQCTAGLVTMTLCIGIVANARADDDWKASSAYKEMNERITTLAQTSGLTASARQQCLDELNSVAEEIDRVWREAEDMEGYSRLALQVVKSLASIDGIELRGQYLAQNWAIRALEKSDVMPLEVECAIVSFVQHDSDAAGKALSGESLAKVRKVQASLWLHAWQRIDRVIDRQWNPADTGVANVIPPDGSPAGIAPAAIADPRLRAQYEADIAANRLKIAKATEQIRARDLQKYWVRMAKRFLIRSYMEVPDKTEELQTLLGQYVTDAADREQILDAVKNKKMPEELVLRNTTQPAE